jgi:pimeloyl-ACP methyl ester carboxylesterase
MTRSGVVQRPDGARIPWEVLGDGEGPRVAFGHSLMAGGLGGEPIYRPLLDGGWTMLALDQRGHGTASPPPGGDFAVETLAGDMLAVLDAAGWDTAWFGGGSMGAAVATAAAAMAPQRVEGLALMAPAIGSAINPALQPFAALGDVFARDGLDAGIAAYAAMARETGATDDVLAWREQLLRRHPAESWAAVLRGIARWDLAPALDVVQQLDVPAAVIAWSGDEVHPLRVAEELIARLRDAHLHVLQDWDGDPSHLFRVMLDMTQSVSAARPR